MNKLFIIEIITNIIITFNILILQFLLMFTFKYKLLSLIKVNYEINF